MKGKSGKSPGKATLSQLIEMLEPEVEHRQGRVNWESTWLHGVSAPTTSTIDTIAITTIANQAATTTPVGISVGGEDRECIVVYVCNGD